MWITTSKENLFFFLLHSFLTTLQGSQASSRIRFFFCSTFFLQFDGIKSSDKCFKFPPHSVGINFSHTHTRVSTSSGIIVKVTQRIIFVFCCSTRKAVSLLSRKIVFIEMKIFTNQWIFLLAFKWWEEILKTEKWNENQAAAMRCLWVEYLKFWSICFGKVFGSVSPFKFSDWLYPKFMLLKNFAVFRKQRLKIFHCRKSCWRIFCRIFSSRASFNEISFFTK